MRSLRVTWAVALGFALACGPGGETASESAGGSAPGAKAENAGEAPVGAVRGVVRDARTDRPIAGALVSAGEYGTSTDEGGAYVMTALPPGPMKLRAYRRGFRAESTTVVVRAGTSSVVDVGLVPAAPPCCTLDGRWAGRFSLDSAGLNARPRQRELEGSLAFIASEAPVRPQDRVAEASGRADLDFAPLLGTDVPGGLRDISGLVFHGDSVAITLLPRLGDWALELRGRQAADTIRGNWFQRASCCGAYGRFVLVREHPTDRGGRGLQ